MNDLEMTEKEKTIENELLDYIIKLEKENKRKKIYSEKEVKNKVKNQIELRMDMLK